MKNLKRSWLFLFGLMAVPYVVLFAVGSIWLYERGYLWEFLAFTVVLMLIGVPLLRWLRARSRAKRSVASASATGPAAFEDVQPDLNWPPAGQQAWREVEAIAQRVQAQDLALDQPEVYWAILQEILETVARQFHPEAKADAALEIPVPHALRTVEYVARDLRIAFADHVPGAHFLTLNDFRKLKRLADWSQRLYLAYRVASIGVNPFGALLREVRDAATNQMLDTSTSDVKQWAVGFCVRKTGYYAIQMYCGQMGFDEADLRAFQSVMTQRDADRAGAFDDRLAEEPLRVLVLGQVKAGKSSLVNALFGETRAAVDVVPRTKNVEPYVLQRDGIPRAIILDTAGYDEADPAASPFAAFKEHVLQCDLVLVVVSARSASRAADRRLLDELRAFFLSQPDRILPPVVVALTHIDQVRPLAEWSPPYDLAQPSCPKAQNIRDAVQAAQEDLALAEDQVVVPVSLRPEQLYNVEEGLAPAILNAVPEAQRVKYLRCLRQLHEAEYWQRLWQQTLNSGRVLFKAGVSWLGQKTK